MTDLQHNRRATPQEIRAARRRILSIDGPGIRAAAQALGKSSGWLSEALRGKTTTGLMLADLRVLRTLTTNHRQLTDQVHKTAARTLAEEGSGGR